MSAARVDAERFERKYELDPDPWGYESSAYEREKYAATLAALPDRQFGAALEVGCSIGVFTRLLAARCERLLAIDFSQRALDAARVRLRDDAGVELRRAAFPEDVEPEGWDLVVLSEVLYYLDAATLDAAFPWIERALSSGATVLAVSWRGPGVEEPLRGDDVHDRLAAELASRHALDARRSGWRLDRFDGDGG